MGGRAEVLFVGFDAVDPAAGSPGSQPRPPWRAATIDVTDIAPRVASLVGVELPRR